MQVLHRRIKKNKSGVKLKKTVFFLIMKTTKLPNLVRLSALQRFFYINFRSVYVVTWLAIVGVVE